MKPREYSAPKVKGPKPQFNGTLIADMPTMRRVRHELAEHGVPYVGELDPMRLAKLVGQVMGRRSSSIPRSVAGAARLLHHWLDSLSVKATEKPVFEFKPWVPPDGYLRVDPARSTRRFPSRIGDKRIYWRAPENTES